MVENDVIDFLMEELAHPSANPRKIRDAVKKLAGFAPETRRGRRMLINQLIDSLFDRYFRGFSDRVELGMALKARLNRHVYARCVPARQACVILRLDKPRKVVRSTSLTSQLP